MAKARTIAAVVALLVSATACSSVVEGTPRPRLVAGTIQASFPSADEISAVAGTQLTPGPGLDAPPVPLAADPAACAVAVGPATQSVYARGWTGFRSAAYEELDTDNGYVVTLVLGVYPDEKQAGAVFGALAEGVKQCPSAVRTDGNEQTSKWTYQAGAATASAFEWTANQTPSADENDWWACYRRARLKGKAVVQVAVCEAGDGNQAATKLIDQFAGKVGG
ncbi:PknH-like extracellular domain-containing protein [Amycolatopsis xylanica]|uniref:PknH-like extracellular domain-containing protein n=1 Tax=Amycolatopsis xylanica TaxID=589385 RepID=A0A1H2T003_9PSEU|nr:sensor domain-containing protein [Amycolatopsis xylanica]SDW37117.1 PknH-like extracellular domain-containing protein [Amycolatopsis xylanica]